MYNYKNYVYTAILRHIQNDETILIVIRSVALKNIKKLYDSIDRLLSYTQT